MNGYLEQLNDRQRAAVTYLDGPELVIAGAGSGKTRVLTYKIVHLLHNGYDPYRIMALTFTNKAAREMRERIEALVGNEMASRLWMGTFHSIFARLLRVNAERLGYRHDYTIYDDTDARSLVKIIVRDMALDEKVYKPAVVADKISELKNRLISPAMYSADTAMQEADDRAGRPLIYKIYQAYVDRCRIAGAMDFDDLLFNTNVLLRDNPDVLENYRNHFLYYLVDEYQDTNFAQHAIMMQLCGADGNLCVVGDDAQSIYSFRGAHIDNILKLERFYPRLRTFKLERNYRSTRTITAAANSLIAANRHQIPKHLYSEAEQGMPIEVVQCYNDYEESFVVSNHIVQTKHRAGDRYSDFAILYRTNAQSRVLEQALSRGGARDTHGNVRDAIPYRIYGGLSFYKRKEIKDALAYFRLAINSHDDESLLRVINYPPRGIGDVTISKLRHGAMIHNVSVWTVLCDTEQYGIDVNRGTRSKLNGFAMLINDLRDKTANSANALTAANHIITATNLLGVLQQERTPENVSRRQNITELLNAVAEFVGNKTEEGLDGLTLADFLAEAALLTDQDTEDATEDRVTLMTVHAAKGLEFKHVIIVGVEEDLFPNALAATAEEIEEERRLLYVAITRAGKTCLITYATSRYINGTTRLCNPSRFLGDIDNAYLRIARRNVTAVESNTPVARPAFFDRRPVARTPTNSRYTSPRDSSARQSVEPKPTSKPVANNGEPALHTADELNSGMTIVHNRFGRGTITKMETVPDNKITVNFDEYGERTLMLKFARFIIL